MSRVPDRAAHHPPARERLRQLSRACRARRRRSPTSSRSRARARQPRPSRRPRGLRRREGDDELPVVVADEGALVDAADAYLVGDPGLGEQPRPGRRRRREHEPHPTRVARRRGRRMAGWRGSGRGGVQRMLVAAVVVDAAYWSLWFADRSAWRARRAAPTPTSRTPSPSPTHGWRSPACSRSLPCPVARRMRCCGCSPRAAAGSTCSRWTCSTTWSTGSTARAAAASSRPASTSSPSFSPWSRSAGRGGTGSSCSGRTVRPSHDEQEM